jgi:MSHA biogenesis protein MshO
MQHLRNKINVKGRRHQAGFTLIEIMMVIVILGIIGAVGADFIASMFQGFSQTNSRLAIYEEGKDALVRMERELHGMLPNAICVTNDGGLSCIGSGVPGNEIRFGMILEDVMRSSNLIGEYEEAAVNFPRVAPATLTDVNSGAVPPVGKIVSVYNTDWSSFVGGARLFRITSGSANEMTFGGQTINDPSPQRRYYVLDRGVSYRHDSVTNTLFRRVTTISGGGLGNFSNSVEYPLARDIENVRFYYMAPSLARNGIISVLFTMTKDGHSIAMHKEIHVKNVP